MTRDDEAMAAIEHYICVHGFPPTRREVQRALGWKSLDTVDSSIRRLNRAGRISVEKGCARSILSMSPTENFIRQLRIAIREAQHDVPLEKVAKRSGISVTVLKSVTTFLSSSSPPRAPA